MTETLQYCAERPCVCKVGNITMPANHWTSCPLPTPSTSARQLVATRAGEETEVVQGKENLSATSYCMLSVGMSSILDCEHDRSFANVRISLL